MNKTLAREHLDFGLTLAAEGNLQLAVAAFCKAIELDPSYSKAYNNLGLVLMGLNQLEQAEVCLRRAVDLAPQDPEVYNNLGLVFLEQNSLANAKDCLLQALELNSLNPKVHNNLGLVWEELKCLDQAEASFREAVKQQADYAEAYYNLGNLLKGLKRLDDAELAYCQAIALRPDYGQAQFALAVLQLLQGRFEQGWEQYDYLRMAHSDPAPLDISPWQGQDLTGCSILLFHEQGFGDTIQFVRYVKLMALKAANIVLWVQKPLESLMASSFPELSVYAGEDRPSGNYDYACPLPSLPRIFQTSLEEIPESHFYLKTDPEISRVWRKRLGPINPQKSYRVGVVWAGNPQHHNDRNRSISFVQFKELLESQAATWVSLQVGNRASDLCSEKYLIFDFHQELTDFAQTAGVIDNLDLVITVDSAVAHLAGSMGKKTWILVPYDPDWRWLLKRQDSPWYDSVRLFRQQELGNWEPVLQQVKAELKQEVLKV